MGRFFGRTHDLWERASAFVPRYNQCFVDFFKRWKIDLNVTDGCIPNNA